MDQTIDYTADMAEKLFLNTMKSNKIGSDSIFIYQYVGSTWKKLKLNTDGSVNKDEECPPL